MIYISTSNGIFTCNEHSGEVMQILSNKHTPGLFKKRGHGYFGICYHANSNSIIASSREKLGTKSVGKPTTDTKLHRIDTTTGAHSLIATIRDAHDIHQIDCEGDIIYLTDTGKNRIIAYDVAADRLYKLLNVGEVRDDIHHVNAVTVRNDELLVMLNNRGHRDSEILTVPLAAIQQSDVTEFDILPLGTVTPIAGVRYAHDVEPYEETLLCCSSHDGIVVDTATSEPFLKADNWVRGITAAPNGLWVGSSHYAKRSRRHSKKNHGTILHYDSDTHKLLKKVTILGAGQINDLIYIPI